MTGAGSRLRRYVPASGTVPGGLADAFADLTEIAAASHGVAATSTKVMRAVVRDRT